MLLGVPPSAWLVDGVPWRSCRQARTPNPTSEAHPTPHPLAIADNPVPPHACTPCPVCPLPPRPARPSRSEFVTNHHRDSIASAVGHYDMLAYLSAGQNEAPGRVRFRMLDRMLQPCGPPPASDVVEASRRLGATA